MEAAAADSVSRWKRALALDLEATVVLAAREEGKRDGIRPWRRSGRMGWAVTGIAHCIFPHQSLAAPFSPLAAVEREEMSLASFPSVLYLLWIRSRKCNGLPKVRL